MIYMKSYPKKLRKKLSAWKYQRLRRKVYEEQFYRCIKCAKFLNFWEFSLHHIKTKGAGGDDSRDNVEGYCLKCHPD